MASDHLLFIEETGARPRDPVRKTRIRSHVRQKRPKAEGHQPRARRLESKDSQGSQLQTNFINAPENLFGVGDMIRLAGLPVELCGTDAKFILYHFLHTRSPLLCTIASETGWLKHALKDGALFHSTLYYWALLNNSFLPPKYQSQEFLMGLKGLAISRITSRLSSTSQNRVDDEVIASVACLANVHLKVGNFGEARIHFRGLAAILRSRQEIHTLGYEGLIGRLLKATDSCHAQAFPDKLLFEEPTQTPRPRRESFVPLTFSFQGITSHLRGIARQLIASPLGTCSWEERVRLGELLLASDREILRHKSISPPCIATVLANSALLYSHIVLRGTGPCHPLSKSVAVQLKSSILATYALRNDCFDGIPMALVWVLFVGVLSSVKGGPEAIWFNSCLMKACENDLERIIGPLQTMVHALNYGTPQSFYWMLQENWVQISSVNTRIV